MKRFLAIGALLAATIQVAAGQKADTAVILVHYKFIHVRDTNNRANPCTENMVLFVGKAASSYQSYDRQVQNELFRKQFQEQLNSSQGHTFRLDRKNSGSGTGYYQFFNERKLVHKELMGETSYVVINPLPVINWHISGNTATFGELHCQKATCHFKGRDYTAWFCPDLPVHTGPWKLNGLPGVIVEAYDAKKEVVFQFERIEKAIAGAMKPVKDRHGRIIKVLGEDDINTDPDIIQLPPNSIKTTDKELERLQKAMIKDPNAFAQAMSGAPANTQAGEPKIDRKASAGPVMNNPMELPEKK